MAVSAATLFPVLLLMYLLSIAHAACYTTVTGCYATSAMTALGPCSSCTRETCALQCLQANAKYIFGGEFLYFDSGIDSKGVSNGTFCYCAANISSAQVVDESLCSVTVRFLDFVISVASMFTCSHDLDADE